MSIQLISVSVSLFCFPGWGYNFTFLTFKSQIHMGIEDIAKSDNWYEFLWVFLKFTLTHWLCMTSTFYTSSYYLASLLHGFTIIISITVIVFIFFINISASLLSLFKVWHACSCPGLINPFMAWFPWFLSHIWCTKMWENCSILSLKRFILSILSRRLLTNLSAKLILDSS